jgi:hypothetical protein
MRFRSRVTEENTGFLSTAKRTFAVPNDVEVSEVEIGCEPYVRILPFSLHRGSTAACEENRGMNANLLVGIYKGTSDKIIYIPFVFNVHESLGATISQIIR